MHPLKISQKNDRKGGGEINPDLTVKYPGFFTASLIETYQT